MQLSQYIDHTLLKPTATESDIKQLCDEARAHGFVSVCVNPFWIGRAFTFLNNSGVSVGTVIDFPLGSGGVLSKSHQAVVAVHEGANELDVVLNIGAILSNKFFAALDEIIEITERVRAVKKDVILKGILECCYLNEKQKAAAVEMCIKGGFDFVKTSTGFGISGATIEDVKLMKSVGKNLIQVKASGGVSSCSSALKMIEAGATRIGTSSGVKIIKEFLDQF